MKVIKQGIAPSEKVYQGECYHCETVVEFKRGEAEFTADQRDGNFLTVKCPTCGNNINVNV